MSDVIVTTIISSVCVLAGSIIASIMSANKSKVLIKADQEHMKEKMDEMSADIKEHNGYAKQMPVIVEKVEKLEKGFDEVKADVKSLMNRR